MKCYIERKCCLQICYGFLGDVSLFRQEIGVSIRNILKLILLGHHTFCSHIFQLFQEPLVTMDEFSSLLSDSIPVVEQSDKRPATNLVEPQENPQQAMQQNVVVRHVLQAPQPQAIVVENNQCKVY